MDINESVIEGIERRWEEFHKCTCPSYWLLGARLLEMTLLCVGNYVDNCEYTLAGDLLFNPRKIEIYQKGQTHPATKHRHGRLSEQVTVDCAPAGGFPAWLVHHVITRTTQPALMPQLRNCLARSGHVSDTYLRAVDHRLRKACCAIGFLNSWSITCAEELHRRIRRASPETRHFVECHLCRFDTAIFIALGKEVHRAAKNPHHQSEFIAPPPC